MKWTDKHFCPRTVYLLVVGRQATASTDSNLKEVTLTAADATVPFKNALLEFELLSIVNVVDSRSEGMAIRRQLQH